MRNPWASPHTVHRHKQIAMAGFVTVLALAFLFATYTTIVNQ